MKLTNHHRDTFVKAAMLDVPYVDYKEQARALFVKTMVAKLPPKVRALWDDNELRPYVKTHQACVLFCSVSAPAPSRDDLVLGPEADAALAQLKIADMAQQETRNALAMSLRSVAYGCTTRKALLEALPEFEKYMPAETPPVSRNLPAIANVVADFTKAGWPKGKK